MNWEAISAIGQLVGVLAVVISLIYLTHEVRSNASATRLAAARSTLDFLNRFSVRFASQITLLFGRLWYGEPNAVSNAIGYAKFSSRSHDAVIRVYDAGNVIETHEHAGEFMAS